MTKINANTDRDRDPKLEPESETLANVSSASANYREDASVKDPTCSKKVRLGQYYTSPRVANFIVSLAETATSGKVIEAGYGRGAFFEALLKAGYADISGYDIDPENYAFVQERFASQINPYCQSFLEASGEPTCDLVIGNPPYVRWGNIDAETRQFLLEDKFWAKYSSGEWDLLYAFIIWSIKMLKEGGELIFIVPYNWFSSTHAAPLRQYLVDHGHFKEIIHFNEYKVFDDASPNTIIFRFLKKPAAAAKIRVVELNSTDLESSQVIAGAGNCLSELACGREVNNDDWQAFEMEQFKSAAPWYLANSAETKIISTIEAKANQQLGELARVGVGVVSGYDRAFIVDDSFYAQLSGPERALVHRFVKARHCQRFKVDQPAWFIWADSIEAETDLRKLPRLHEHLFAHKDSLLARYGADPDLWWHWATVRNLPLFESSLNAPKIFVPCADRAETARFSITDKAYFGSGDVLLIAARGGNNPYYLQAWLGSDVFNRWYRIKGPQTGRRTRYTQSFIASVPVLAETAFSSADRDHLVGNIKLLMNSTDPSEKERLIAENDGIFAGVFPALSSAP